jgi:hypothetical protein
MIHQLESHLDSLGLSVDPLSGDKDVVNSRALHARLVNVMSWIL